ncbi:MAG: DNA cytosine methyltransferase [Actinomycetota bacterium]|nr:DNA cytosine methyltransferase [Actinomycetota bacterium]
MSGNLLLPGCREREWEVGDGFERHGSGLWLPPGDEHEDGYSTVPPLEQQPLGIDLFAGAGGFSCGFKTAGWHVVAASDGWATAAVTYLCNLGGPHTVVHLVGDELPEGTKRETAWHAEHRGEAVSATEFFEVCHAKVGDKELAPGEGWIANEAGVQPCEHFYLGDVRALTGEQILDDLELTGDDIGCVFGGPPCQGFSRAGQRKTDDPRNELVFEFMRIVCEIHPHAFMMENVPGIMDMVTHDGIPVIDAIVRIAEDGGMGTFKAVRQSLAGTAGVGAALLAMETVE